MPWKLIVFLIFLVLTTIFIGFNLDNVCTVNVLFTTFKDAPIFIVVLVSVIFGALISAVFMLSMKFSQSKKNDVKQKVKMTQPSKPVESAINFKYEEALNSVQSKIVSEKDSIVEKPTEGSNA